MLLSTSLHCVKCAKATLTKDGEKAYRCRVCDFVYFHNVAATAGALITYDGHILLLERALDPAKGKLDFPGGFVDYHESSEQALSRELFEELQLSINAPQMSYLYSFPNQYLYQDVVYHTLDNFFEVELLDKPDVVLQESEVSSYQWVKPVDINLEDLAFNSCKQALTSYLKQ